MNPDSRENVIGNEVGQWRSWRQQNFLQLICIHRFTSFHARSNQDSVSKMAAFPRSKSTERIQACGNHHK
jgi:hypothetical protein